MTAALTAIRDLIQEDVGMRGLGTDPTCNLLTSWPEDFAEACQSIARVPQPAIGIVTGFFIPTAQPPGGETDGPLGAIFLARALVPMGIKVTLATDAFGVKALEVGLAACNLSAVVPIVTLPSPGQAPQEYWRFFAARAGSLTHLVAIERVGPSHTVQSMKAQLGAEGTFGDAFLDFLHEVPEEHQDRCHTMRGRDISDIMSPAHYLFEIAEQQTPAITTIGIGDGGNEIGMGKIPWEIIHRNIKRGGLVACRVPTDHLIVCGISNWGAYGLAAGVRLLRGQSNAGLLFDPEWERRLLAIMVERGPLVDGVKGQPSVSVDGIPFDRYGEKLRRLGEIKVS